MVFFGLKRRKNIYFSIPQILHLRFVVILTVEFRREYSCTVYKNCMFFFVFQLTPFVSIINL